MKKPNVLNRSMFNRGGTSAYGRGITSNLVSDEQRQRYNSGGRVKYYEDYKGGPVFMGDMDVPVPKWWHPSWGPVLQTGDKRGRIWDPDLQEYVPAENIYKVTGAELGEEKMDYIPTTYAEMQEIAGLNTGVEGNRPIKRLEDIDIDYMKSQAGSKRDALERSLGYDIGTPVEGGGTKYEVSHTKPDRVFDDTAGDWRKDIAIPGVVKEKEEVEEIIPKGPMGDEMWNAKTVIDEKTDELEVDPWAFLDKQQKAKQKLARGHALMEGAAAAMDWSTAATAKEKSKAISGGLRKAGAIGAKYKGEGEDIKTKAKILGTIEDIKGKHKLDVWEEKLDKYYGKSLDQAQETLDLKKEAARIAATDAPPEEQYQAMLVKGLFKSPQDKADLLGSILKKKIYYAKDSKEEEQYLNPENNGLLFVDVTGTIWRNVKGQKQDVKIYEDTEFFGK